MRKIYYLFFFGLLGLTACHYAGGNKEMSLKNPEAMQKKIIKLFKTVDNHKWHSLKELLADSVFLDYSSMSGQPGAIQTPNQIIEAWSGFLPKFKYTHHQIGNILVQQTGKTVKVSCYGTAYHYIPEAEGGDYWTVIGNYDFELSTNGSDYRVTRMVFNFKFALGNQKLPSIALKS